LGAGRLGLEQEGREFLAPGLCRLVHGRPEQLRHLQRPIDLRPSLPDRDTPPTRQRVAEEEHTCRARPLLLLSTPPWMILGRWDRRPRLLQQLHRLLVHAQHRRAVLKEGLSQGQGAANWGSRQFPAAREEKVASLHVSRHYMMKGCFARGTQV